MNPVCTIMHQRSRLFDALISGAAKRRTLFVFLTLCALCGPLGLQGQPLNTDGYDYPIGDRGYSNGVKVPVPEYLSPETNTMYPISRAVETSRTRGSQSSKSGWWNIQDVGSYYGHDYNGFHSGEDWNFGSGSADIGKEVYAVAHGKVVKLAEASKSKVASRLGWSLVIEHENPDFSRTYSVYTHVCSPDAPGGETDVPFPYGVGELVRKGDLIAKVASLDDQYYDGSNNLVTNMSEHLHFQMFHDPDRKMEPIGPATNLYSGTKGGKGYYETYEDMLAKGIVDASDFIDQHRYPWYRLNDGADLYGGRAGAPLDKVVIWFELPPSEEQVEFTQLLINGVEYSPQLLISGGISRPNNRHEFLLNLTYLRNDGFRNQSYEITLFVNGKYWIKGKNQLYFADPGEFQDNQDPRNWYYPYVRYAVTKGLIKGVRKTVEGEYSSRQVPFFNPGENLTRGQAAKILVLAALNLNYSNGGTDAGRFIDISGTRFLDVREENGFFPYVQTLRNWKNSAGKPCISTDNVRYNWNEPITVEALSKMVCNVFYLSEEDANLHRLKNTLSRKELILNCVHEDLRPYVELLQRIVVFPDVTRDILDESGDLSRRVPVPELLIETFADLTPDDYSSPTLMLYTGQPVKRGMMAKLISNVYAFREAHPYLPSEGLKSVSIPSGILPGSQEAFTSRIEDSPGQNAREILSPGLVEAHTVATDDVPLEQYTIIGHKFELTSDPLGNAPDHSLEGSVTLTGGESRTFDFQTDTWEGQPLFFYWTLSGGDLVPAAVGTRAVTVTAPQVTEDTDIHLYSYRGTPAGKTGEVFITLHVKPSGEAPVTRVLPWFTAAVTDGSAPLTVRFTNLTRLPQGISQPSYLWSFGDGNESTLPEPEHTYAHDGHYTVTLRVTLDAETKTAVREQYISVIPYDPQVATEQIEYFFDTDPGPGNGVLLAQGMSGLQAATEQIDLSALPAGMHTLYSRAKDAHGHWGHPQGKPFLVVEAFPQEENTDLYSAEYYLDHMDQKITSHRTSRQAEVYYDKHLSLEGVEEGFHTLFVRVKDFRGNDSQVMSVPFYLQDEKFVSSPVRNFEYALDAPAGWNTMEVEDPSTEVSQQAVVETDQVSPGMHLLFVRPVDAENQPGPVFFRPFYLEEERLEETLSGYQYAIDGLQEFTSSSQMGGDGELASEWILEMGSFPEGFHTLHVRPVGSSGRVGPVLSRPFFARAEETGQGVLTALEYMVDTLVTPGEGIPLTVVPGQEITVNPVIGLEAVPEGRHILHFRAGDAGGNWGYVKNGMVDVQDVPNGIPVAHAGEDRVVAVNDQVVLDGSLSADPNGNPLTCRWTAPPGIVLNLADPFRPSFVVPVALDGQLLTFTLVVNDGFVNSEPDEVALRVDKSLANHPPVADAGYYEAVPGGAEVRLQGGLSWDEDGDDLTYRWTAPAGVYLTSSDSPEPVFTVPRVSRDTLILLALEVFDGWAWSAPYTVEVPVVSSLRKPVALPGPHLTVMEGTLVPLQGMGSFDPGGGKLTYKWHVPDGITLNADTLANPAFIAPAVEEEKAFTLVLVVSNGLAGGTDTAEVIVVVRKQVVSPLEVGLVQTSVACPDEAGGVVEVTSVSGGTPFSGRNYDFFLNGQYQGRSATFLKERLPAGSWELVVEDSAHVTWQTTLEIEDQVEMSFSAGYSASGGSGERSKVWIDQLSVTGGTRPYRYWAYSADPDFAGEVVVVGSLSDTAEVEVSTPLYARLYDGNGCPSEVRAVVTRQAIVLHPGWNLVSLNLSPGGASLRTLLGKLEQKGTLVKVLDEEGNSLDNLGLFGGWHDAIGRHRTTEGYKVKVNAADTLLLWGQPLELPLSIPLKAGWNIIAFPLLEARDALEVMGGVIARGTLVKVQDEKGNALEDLGSHGGWVNRIGLFQPGEGYKVRVLTDEVLVLFK